MLKVAFLYIGTSIGAGFSSGREIALFFGNSSPYCVMLAGVFISLLCALFLVAGKVNAIPNNYAVKIGIFLSSCISLSSMLAGSEYILSSLTNINLLGIVMAIASGLIVTFGIDKIKWANTILIPLLIVLLIVLYIKINLPVYSGDFTIVKPIRYSCLDVLLGGVILSREGKKLTYKQIVGVSILIMAFMCIILFILQNVVLTDKMNSSMPVLAVSEQLGLKWVCGILIAIAILTTLISALEIVSSFILDFIKNKRHFEWATNPSNKVIVVFSTLTIFYPMTFVGFENIVDTLYPFVSISGMIIVVWTTINLTKVAYKKIKRNKYKKLASII